MIFMARHIHGNNIYHNISCYENNVQTKKNMQHIQTGSRGRSQARSQTHELNCNKIGLIFIQLILLIMANQKDSYIHGG